MSRHFQKQVASFSCRYKAKLPIYLGLLELKCTQYCPLNSECIDGFCKCSTGYGGNPLFGCEGRRFFRVMDGWFLYPSESVNYIAFIRLRFLEKRQCDWIERLPDYSTNLFDTIISELAFWDKNFSRFYRI